MIANLTTQATRINHIRASHWTLACMACLMLTSSASAYPPAGDDVTPATNGTISLTLTGVGTDNFSILGSTTVHRGSECVACGPGGRDTIATQINAMNLTGNSGVLGPIVVNQSSTLASTGQISQQTPSVDFPASSFFDIFVEIQTSQGLLHNNATDHLQGVITNIPIGNGMTHNSSAAVALFNPANQEVGSINSFSLFTPSVPEPSSLALFGVGAIYFLRRPARRNARK